MLLLRHAIKVRIRCCRLTRVLAQLADKWSGITENSGSGYSAVIDVTMWLGKATLDAYVPVLEFGLRGLRTTHELISPKRIGAGAFDYDFGALDGIDNPFTKSYTNLVYDHLSSSEVPAALTVCPSVSFGAFGNPTRFLVFLMSITGWFPGLITWVYNNSNNPGIQNLRWNKEQGQIIARKLVNLKRQELKDGMARKDIMSLLGLSPLPSLLLAWALKTCPLQSNLVILSARNGD